MKSSILLLTVSLGLATAQAAIVNATLSWEGLEFGYFMQGTMTYDDTYTLISAFEGNWVDNKLISLTVSLYDPSATMLRTYELVTNESIDYRWLTFGYDTTSLTFDPDIYGFDMGWGADSEFGYLYYGAFGAGAEVGEGAGNGANGDYLLFLPLPPEGRTLADIGGWVTASASAVPETSSSLALGVLLASALGIRTRRSVAAP